MGGWTRLSRAAWIRIAVGVSMLAILWSFTPPANPRFQVCGFHWLTGRQCPFCGLTRATFALAKGHFSQAIHFNALSPLAFAMLASLLWNYAPVRDRLWTYGIPAFAAYGAWRIFVPSS